MKYVLTKPRRTVRSGKTVRGRIQGNARGFAFLVPEDGSDDLFVPAKSLRGAMHGDTALVKRASRETEYEVVSILTRANETLVGVYAQGAVLPDERRIPYRVRVTGGERRPAEGDKVVVRMTRYPDGVHPAEGRVTEVLGAAHGKGVDVLSVIRRSGFAERFPAAVREAAEAIPDAIPAGELARREDWRDTLTVTIDGADSRDFDDAVSLERLENGNWRLGVHIADVSYYVPEGGAIDREARLRGTSVYFPDRVLPMLPEKLSNGVCSLNPNEDRLAMSCILELDRSGAVVGHRLAETVIRSRYRLVYERVSSLLAGDRALAAEYGALLPMLTDLEALTRLLETRRTARGSIDFDVPEPRITLDENGAAVDVRRAERGIANRIIESCMILANEAVASHIERMQIPFLYRVHESPAADRLQSLADCLKTLHLTLERVADARPRDVQRLLDDAKGTDAETLIGKLLLRAMAKARYSESNLGHFGLASDCYCHFTSPIRRYPDLVCHRILRRTLQNAWTPERLQRLARELPAIALSTSESERAAMEAERTVDGMKIAEYMRAHIGETFLGTVSGVTQAGVFVELPNTAEGLIRLAAFSDDFYRVDLKRFSIIGERTGRRIRLGDPLRVRVLAADPAVPAIDFTPESVYDSINMQELAREAPRKGRKGHGRQARRQGARTKPKGKT